MTEECGDKMLHLTRATEGLTLDRRGGENSLGWVGEIQAPKHFILKLFSLLLLYMGKLRHAFR